MSRKLTQKIRNFAEGFDWQLNDKIVDLDGQTILVYTSTYRDNITKEAREWKVNISRFNQQDDDGDTQVFIIDWDEKKNEMTLDLFYHVYENNKEDARNILFDIYDTLTCNWGLE